MFVLQVVWLCGMGTGGRRDRVTFGEPRRWGTRISGQAGVLDTQAGPDIPGTLTQEHPGQPDSWESLRPQRAKTPVIIIIHWSFRTQMTLFANF
ncbi:hypothetical protein MKY19_20540 [Paenibacillus sp. FSL R5-0744]|uniref:hypothetical protein n=1 Tax=Paenibacillus sp. FSL R5-0744 TaxID=2921656 RepID=UPI0030D7DBF2